MRIVLDMCMFPIELFAAEVLFCVLLKKREKFVYRIIAAFAVFALSAYTSWLITELFDTTGLILRGIIHLLRFLILFGISVGLICFCYDCKVLHAVFCGIGAYASQHLMYRLTFIIVLIFQMDYYSVWTLLTELACGAALYFAEYLLFVRRCKNDDAPSLDNKRVIVMAVIILAVTIVLSIQSQIFVRGRAENIICSLCLAMCCLTALIILNGFYREGKLQRENEITERVLNQVGKQRQMTKESVDIINRKCHDLKHQIRALKSISDGQERQEVIDEIEKAVMFYELEAKTGNEALDFVLTEKSFVCKENDVKLTYMIDGKSLDFIKTADICTIFGNALDNAIECEMNVPDVDDRIITLNIFRKDSFLSINISNYAPDPITFDAGGLPVDRTKDERFHGYGVKSIKYVVEKYRGYMIMKQEHDLFTLNIMLPCGEDIKN